MTLTHYSKKLVRKLTETVQDNCKQFKPNGFWYSVDGDWERWCEAEQWGDLPSKIRHELVLDGEKILRLTTVAAILKFHQRYAGSPILPGLTFMMYPDWRRVADKYDGIEIAPYQWSLRLDQRVHWYYAWDCASGCLWRPRGARFVTPRSKKPAIPSPTKTLTRKA